MILNLFISFFENILINNNKQIVLKLNYNFTHKFIKFNQNIESLYVL